MSDSGQLDFATYPEFPGSKGTSETGVEAAVAIAPAAATLRAKALVHIRAAGLQGLTSEELAGVMGVEYGSIQPRTSELRRLAQIVDSKLRRTNTISRKRVVVWVASEFGPVEAEAA